MKTIKNTRDVSKSPNIREALKTPEKQRAPLSFRNIPATEESEADYPPKYRDLFSQHQRLKDESSQDSEGSSISVSDQDEEELEDQSSEKNQRKYTQTPETNALDRWKILYAQKEKYDLKREQLRKERKGPEADPECTFKPKLLTSNANIPSVASALPIHERNRLWKEKQQAKLKESSQKEEQRDLSDCTFKPLVNPSKKVKDADRLVNQECRGVNQFLKRQATARQTKEEKEILLSNPLSRLPEHATKREGKTTIGKYPNLLTSADKHGEGSVSKKGDMFPTVSPKNNTQTPLRNRKNSTQEISFSNENCKAEGPIQDNPIYISEVTYFDAIKKLREELHKIPLNID